MARIVAFNHEKPWLGGNIMGGDENTWCPAIWDYLIRQLNPISILDVGCGEGHLIEYFYKQGLYVTGIDGLEQNKLNAPAAVKDHIIIHDFRKRMLEPPPQASIVISCEFVEHVDEKYSLNYLEIFQRSSYTVFTHGVPGQPGHNHVNCRDDAYWIDTMKVLGYDLLQPETEIARGLSGGNLWNTVLIFIRK